MNILILGGTVFLGRHLVATGQAAGHKISTFNRGTNRLEEQNNIERLVGDRTKNISALIGKRWDAVVDTCGMEPDTVGITVNELMGSVGQYVYISSISAYDNFRRVEMDEGAATKLRPRNEEQDYGSNKAWSEKVVSDAFQNQSLIIRPGLLVGKYDPTDRFTYWPRRIAKGGVVLAPGRYDRTIQFIDVRDVSEWIIRLIEAQINGAFNLTGPFYPLTMKDFLHTCRDECGSNAEFAFIDDEQLGLVDVKPWTELPLWIPESDSDHIGFMQIDCLRAQNTGLSYRPIAETIEEVLAWDKTRDQSVPLKAGLSAEREKQLLSVLVAPQ